MPRDWPKDRSVMLCDLIARGYSFLQAAKEMSGVFGALITRNAVAGRANRLKLPTAQVKQSNQRKPRARKVPVVTKAPPTAVPEPAPPEPLAITIYELTSETCRFPLGGFEAHPPYLYCGLPKQEDSSYCLHHTRVTRGL